MNHYTIDILKTDFSYVVEAIRMRGYALADQITAQAIEQEKKKENSWTVTTDGENIVAVNKETKAKRSPDTPYGLKKDGTRAKRRGRPAKAKS